MMSQLQVLYFLLLNTTYISIIAPYILAEQVVEFNTVCMRTLCHFPTHMATELKVCESTAGSRAWCSESPDTGVSLALVREAALTG